MLDTTREPGIAGEGHATLTHAADDGARRQLWMLGGIALGAMALIIWFFSPRYALWAALAVPELNGYADTHRAVFTLLQLDNPFVDIDNFSNRVIEWRLLFPLIFHYLRLPKGLFLAMPWIGCLLVLWYVARLVWERTQRPWLTAAATVLIGTTSWFFTSTGWLTYFDSWYVLGALILAFGRSFPVVIAAALITPWIDERIVFMVPACLAARAAIGWHDTGRAMPAARELRLIAATVVAVGVYALVRVAAVLWLDSGSQEYVQFIQDRAYPVSALMAGAWMGLRLAWIPVLALPFVVRSRPLAIAVGLAVALSLTFAVVIAGDVSRSMSMLIPIAVAGVILIAAVRPDAEKVLLVLAAGNLLLPAAHVVTSFTIPIFSARYELHQLESPPEIFDVEWHLGNAVRQAQEGDTASAAYSLFVARRLAHDDEGLPLALARFAETEREAGRAQSAVFFYRQALNAGPADWQARGPVQARLDELLRSVPTAAR